MYVGIDFCKDFVEILDVVVLEAFGFNGLFYYGGECCFKFHRTGVAEVEFYVGRVVDYVFADYQHPVEFFV